MRPQPGPRHLRPARRSLQRAQPQRRAEVGNHLPMDGGGYRVTERTWDRLKEKAES
jgi:hypothetical protein